MEKGNLILSTKKEQTKRLLFIAVTGGIGSILAIGAAIFIFCNPEIFRPLSGSSYRMISVLFGIALLCSPFYSFYNFAVVWFGQKSYIAVYEKYVEGYTVVSKTVPQKEFRVPYSDILNISVTANQISIHTQYATFEALAMVNKDRAVEEIRNRIVAKEVVK